MKRLATVLAMLSMATPVSATVREAAFSSSGDRPQARSSMFAGATLRVGLDRRSSPAPRAALRFSGMAHVPGTAELRFGDGLEIAGGKTGQPAVYLAGQDFGEVKRKANLSTGAAIAIGVGAVVLIGGGILVYAMTRDCYDEDQQSRCD